MAKIVLNNAKVVLDSYDLGNLVSQVTITIQKDLLESTGMGDMFKTRIPSFQDWSASLTFFDDLADNALNEKMFDWVTSTSPISVAIRATDTTIAADNPEYTGECWIQTAPVLSGAVAQVAGGQLQLVGQGALVRDITP